MGWERLLRRGGSLISSLERDLGVADLVCVLLPRVLRSCRAEALEGVVIVGAGAEGLVGGGAARADRRVGEGIALPTSNLCAR